MNGKKLKFTVKTAAVTVRYAARNVTLLSIWFTRLIHVTPENSIAKYIIDHYSNYYPPASSTVTTYTYGGTGATVSGGSGGTSYTPYASGGVINYPVTITPTITLGPAVIEQLMKELVTKYKDGEPLVVCVDNDFTTAQVQELAQTLIDADIKGVIISGARAGTGKNIHGDLKEQYQLIDVLGRIGMVWQQHPQLNFTDLIAWYKGEHMDDDHFAAAIDVYVKKIYGE